MCERYRHRRQFCHFRNAGSPFGHRPRLDRSVRDQPRIELTRARVLMLTGERFNGQKAVALRDRQ